jgi:hypothetical protein
MVHCLSTRVIGPIFFSETITAERYRELIMNFIPLFEADEQDCWFQEDWAAVHTASSTMQMMNEFFSGRNISLNLWPPPSPDLSPPDYYLWGFLKENVYKNNRHILEELKENADLCTSKITAENLSQVASDMRKRVNECIAERGRHFQHLI